MKITFKLLLKSGAEIEAKDEIGMTPLILASMYNRVEIVKVKDSFNSYFKG